MQQAVPNIYCPNLRCRAANPEGESVCKVCGTSIPRRYVWVIGATSTVYQTGDVLFDRYVFKGPQVVIDTQPGLPLASAFDITDDVLPYLKLFPFRLHLPQLYSLLKIAPPDAETDAQPEILALLEGAPLTPADFGSPTQQPHSELLQRVAVAQNFTDAWRTASVLRQIHWLWQMVELWDPLQREGVAWSLVNPDLLRVEGPLLRLLSLDFNPKTVPSLAVLGEFWAKWCLPHLGEWRTQFADLCDRLVSENLATTSVLSTALEEWLAIVRASYEVTIDISTCTDPGPSRDQNEDACYPPPSDGGMVLHNSREGLLIVCDGVGGHEGGEVASGTAISALTAHLKQTPLPQRSAHEVMAESETAVGIANDLIVKQNDQEDRHDRDRMGTTVVMALAQGPDLYLTNLGDSRAYLITAQGCYQLTTDDDIATREVRLGYLPYRDAVRQPGSGSLIQALGMVPSSMLRPSVQRFIVDSDCIFLLCSDGLSDFERVETLWSQHLLPLLSGQIDLTQASKTLIAQANRLNGHDNVTVGLLHYHVTPLSPSEQPTKIEIDPSQAWPSSLPPTQVTPVKTTQKSFAKSTKQKSSWPLLMLIALVGGAGIALGLLLWPKAAVPPIASTASPSSPVLSPEPLVDSYWTVRRTFDNTSVSSTAAEPTLDLKVEPKDNAESGAILTHGVVLKIMGSQKNADPNQTSWYQVRVCGRLPGQTSSVIVPSPAASNGLPKPSPSVQQPKVSSKKSSVNVGYIRAKEFARVAVLIEPAQLSALNLEGCPAAAQEEALTPPSPSSSPVPPSTTP
jgi:protein phosphatase